MWWAREISNPWERSKTNVKVRQLSAFEAQRGIFKSVSIDVKTEDEIATVTMRHGKANALDITLCESLADCFDRLRTSNARAVVLTGQGHIFSAGVDLLQVSAGGAELHPQVSPGAASHLRGRVLSSETAGGGSQQPCHCRRLRARLLRRPAHHGARQRACGYYRASSRRAVSRRSPSRSCASPCLDGISRNSPIPARPTISRPRWRAGWVDELVDAYALTQRARNAAQQMARLSPRAFTQAKKQLRRGPEQSRARRRHDRPGRHRHLDRGARLYPRHGARRFGCARTFACDGGQERCIGKCGSICSIA